MAGKGDGRFNSKLFVVNRFRAGKLDERKQDSIDFSLLQHGCQELVNGIPLIGGGVRRRPGVKFWKNADGEATAPRPTQQNRYQELGFGGRIWLGNDPHVVLLVRLGQLMHCRIFKSGPNGERVDVGVSNTISAAMLYHEGQDPRDIHISQRDDGVVIISNDNHPLLELRQGNDDNENLGPLYEYESATWKLSVMTIYNPPMELFHGTLAEAKATDEEGNDRYYAVEIPANSGKVYWSEDDGATWKDDTIAIDKDYDKTKVRGYFVEWDQQNAPVLVAFDEGENDGHGKRLADFADPGEGNLDPTEAETVRHIGTALPPGVYRLQMGKEFGFPTRAEFHGDALHVAIGTRLYRSFIGLPNDFTQQRARVIPIRGEGSPDITYGGSGDVEADFGTLHYLPQGEPIKNVISYTELLVQTDRGTYRLVGSAGGVAANRVNSGLALQYRFGQREGMNSLVIENSMVGFDGKKGRLYYTSFSGEEVGFRAVDLGVMRNSEIMVKSPNGEKSNTRHLAPLYIPDAANVIVGLRENGTLWVMSFHVSELSAESSVFAFSEFDFPIEQEQEYADDLPEAA